MRLFFTLLFVFFTLTLRAVSLGESDSISAKSGKKKLLILGVGVNAAYIGSMVVLNEIWYKNQPRSPFHFFNDNGEWLQMDKAGHFTTSFHESVFGVKALRWAGVPEKKAMILGSLAGFVYQTPIEILDGYVETYGASWGDVIANSSGSALVLGQYLLWKEIRFQPKFSFHQTGFAPLSPNLLGKSLNEQIIKDYNGQTYWFSFNMYSFVKNRFTGFPKWLNLAVGYGAENMIRAQKSQSTALGYHPYRQYYLSLDIDFSRVRLKKKWMKYVLYPLNFIHIPFPAVEFNKHKVVLHGLYF